MGSWNWKSPIRWHTYRAIAPCCQLEEGLARIKNSVVVVESVLGFVEDKARAIRERGRVTKPGGYVGLNESFWTEEPSPEIIAQARRQLGVDIPTVGTCQALWEASGLRDRVTRIHQIDARKEIQGRLQWVGARWALRAVGRLKNTLSSSISGYAETSDQFCTSDWLYYDDAAV